jgi:hypothetical protein
VVFAISAKGRLADFAVLEVAVGLAFLAVVDFGIAVSPFFGSILLLTLMHSIIVRSKVK